MNILLKTLSEFLKEKAADIDAGNSNISDDELMEMLENFNVITTKNSRMSKDQACSYLNVSRATFDNYVRNGDIPKGKKQRGFKELSWNKLDLDKAIYTLCKQSNENL